MTTPTPLDTPAADPEHYGADALAWMRAQAVAIVGEDARAWGPLYLSRVLSLYIQPPTKAPAPQGAAPGASQDLDQRITAFAEAVRAYHDPENDAATCKRLLAEMEMSRAKLVSGLTAIPDQCSIHSHYVNADGSGCLCGYFTKRAAQGAPHEGEGLDLEALAKALCLRFPMGVPWTAYREDAKAVIAEVRRLRAGRAS